MKDCNSCGKCCLKYGGGDLAASKEDIEGWELYHPEIFKYVKKEQIWFDPDTGKRMSRCPFLHAAPKNANQKSERYTCSIYQNRPEDCRLYPSLISEMIRDECEMIETKDLKSSSKAQRELDVLMHDSRFQI